jgi:phage gpG-like protein
VSDDRAWRKILKTIGKMVSSDPHVRVGVLADKGGSAGHGDGGMTVLQVATIHEFGAPAAGIPERSFIRSTATNKEPEAAKMAERLAKAVVEGRMKPEKALDIYGTWFAAEVKKTITEQDIPPPLQPETIERKGSSKPLVDSGQLVQSITHEVVKR